MVEKLKYIANEEVLREIDVLGYGNSFTMTLLTSVIRLIDWDN